LGRQPCGPVRTILGLRWWFPMIPDAAERLFRNAGSGRISTAFCVSATGSARISINIRTTRRRCHSISTNCWLWLHPARCMLPALPGMSGLIRKGSFSLPPKPHGSMRFTDWRDCRPTGCRRSECRCTVDVSATISGKASTMLRRLIGGISFRLPISTWN